MLQRFDFYLKKARGFLPLAFLVLTSCASYQSKVFQARNFMERGDYQEASSLLEDKAYTEGKDQLIYLLDYATALQGAGDYKASNQAFEKALEVAEMKDYHSISKQALSLLFNQEQVQYKGEIYEKVLIPVMKALNYLSLGQYEAAQVEARRINEKIYYYKSEKENNFEFDQFFNHYLSAIVWEAGKQWDDAYIDYKRAYKLKPSFKYILNDLARTAYYSRRLADVAKWRRKGGEFSSQGIKNQGEVIMVFLQGWGPRKRQSLQSQVIAQLYPMESFVNRLCFNVKELSQSECSVLSLDIDGISVKSYNSQIPGLIAKRVAALASKKALQHNLDKNNKGLGSLLYLGMRVSERADVRQWSTLPKTIQVSRFFAPAGRYSYSISTPARSFSSDSGEVKSLELKAGETKVILVRAY